jgi:hypothetical protein
MHSKLVRRQAVTIPIGRGKESGRAFSIDDALLAMRWAGLVHGRGYRLTFSHLFKNADEVIEIHIPPHTFPLARIHRGNRVLWLTDCVGHNRVFLTLADALAWVAPLSARESRVMQKSINPGWLWKPQAATRQRSSVWRQVKATAMSWAKWLAPL